MLHVPGHRDLDFFVYARDATCSALPLLWPDNLHPVTTAFQSHFAKVILVDSNIFWMFLVEEDDLGGGR